MRVSAQTVALVSVFGRLRINTINTLKDRLALISQATALLPSSPTASCIARCTLLGCSVWKCDTSLESQRKEPRLPGRRSRTGQGSSAEPQPVRRMVSVPLPAAAPAAPSQPNMGADVPDLMDFGTYTVPSYSAPARPLGEEGFTSLIDDTLNGTAFSVSHLHPESDAYTEM